MDLSDIASCYKSYVETETPHRCMVDRYFVKRYKIDVKRKLSEDLCILEHSNRICIVTLAPSHPIVTDKKQIVKVDYQADNKTSRLDNVVSGKSKRGAQSINEGSPLCHITCTDGTVYTVYGCIHAGLVEVNERLLTNPQLVADKPDTEGYVAILLTRKPEHDREMAKLRTAEQYDQAVADRKMHSVAGTIINRTTSAQLTAETVDSVVKPSDNEPLQADAACAVNK